MTKLIVAFRNFTNAPKKRYTSSNKVNVREMEYEGCCTGSRDPFCICGTDLLVSHTKVFVVRSGNLRLVQVCFNSGVLTVNQAVTVANLVRHTDCTAKFHS